MLGVSGGPARSWAKTSTCCSEDKLDQSEGLKGRGYVSGHFRQRSAKAVQASDNDVSYLFTKITQTQNETSKTRKEHEKQ